MGVEPLSEQLQQLTGKIEAILYALQRWDALHYTGHFIDAHPEMKERIDEVHKETTAALHGFGIVTAEQRFKR